MTGKLMGRMKEPVCIQTKPINLHSEPVGRLYPELGIRIKDQAVKPELRFVALRRRSLLYTELNLGPIR